MATKAADSFRVNVRAILEARELTIQDLADGIGSGRPSVSRVLAGHEKVTIERAERIAGFLKIPLTELLSENSSKVA